MDNTGNLEIMLKRREFGNYVTAGTTLGMLPIYRESTGSFLILKIKDIVNFATIFHN